MKQSNENNLELVPVEATNNISVVGDSMYSWPGVLEKS